MKMSKLLPATEDETPRIQYTAHGRFDGMRRVMRAEDREFYQTGVDADSLLSEGVSFREPMAKG